MVKRVFSWLWLAVALTARADLSLSGNGSVSGAVSLSAIVLPDPPGAIRATNTVDYWLNFEQDGLLTTAKLTNSTSTSGWFSFSATPDTSMLFTNEAAKALHSYVKVGGTVYDDVGGTRGLKCDLSITNTDYIRMSLPDGYDEIAIAGFFKTDHQFVNFNNYDWLMTETNSGQEFVSASLKQLTLRAHTKCDQLSGGDPVSFSANQWYWVCLTAKRSDYGRAYIYSTANWQLVGSTALAVCNFGFNRMLLGGIESHGAITNAHYWLDNWVIKLGSSTPIPP